MAMTPNLRMSFPLFSLLASQFCPMDVSSRALDCLTPEVRAYVEAEHAKLKIIATTVTRGGQVLDWIDPRSQVPDGELGIPPLLTPRLVLPKPDAPDQPEHARGELEDEPEAWGPPGTVPILRPNLRYACGLTLTEWLDGPNSHGGMRSGSP